MAFKHKARRTRIKSMMECDIISLPSSQRVPQITSSGTPEA